jgi:hypothetical protein
MVPRHSLEAFCQVTATDYRGLVAPLISPLQIQQRATAQFRAGGRRPDTGCNRERGMAVITGKAAHHVLMVVQRVVTQLDFRALKR